MRTHISANYRGSIVRIPVSSITHFTSGEKYTTAHHNYEDGGELLTNEALAKLEVEFPYLLRIHRGTLVDRNLITTLRYESERICVVLHGVAKPLTVSRRHLPAIKEMFALGEPK